MANQIRPLAICLFRQGDRILVAEGYDDVKNEFFFRPLGGGIEFEETSTEALQRELMEELQAEIGDLHYLFTLENIFTFNGEKGHEIVLVYDGRLKDEALYGQAILHGVDGIPFKAMWMRLDEFGRGKAILYPDGLLEALQEDRPGTGD
jgi:8-oxo-dGTP pyrophosphatase MutT (NUDIX family)